ncbi:hypothetical protein M0802_004232 [Mischocyttarus mexicanus]|nr:hypothetical protein M0802_004232 [Mischocyttarus mexicanus]
MDMDMQHWIQEQSSSNLNILNTLSDMSPKMGDSLNLCQEEKEEEEEVVEEEGRGERGGKTKKDPTEDALNNVFQYAASSRCPTGKLVVRKSVAFGRTGGGRRWRIKVKVKVEVEVEMRSGGGGGGGGSSGEEEEEEVRP